MFLFASPLLASLLATTLAMTLGAALGAAPKTLLSSAPAGTSSPAAISRAGVALYRHVNPPRPLYSVQRYELKVQSRDEQGRPVTVRAQLFVPQLPKRQALPVYVLGAGTTGLADACSVFNERPERASWGWYQGHMLSYAAQGMIAVLPDYAYFDDPKKLQPYFVSGSEARILLDAARAAYQFFAGPGKALSAQPAPAVFFSGYSQGGHSSFAAADLAGQYAPELPVKGVVVFGATTSVETLFRENAAFAPYVAAAYEDYYGKQQTDSAQILLPKVEAGLDANAKSRCIADLYEMYSKRPQDVFQPAFVQALSSGDLSRYPGWAKALSRNNAGLAKEGLAIPAFIAQGTADDIVTEQAARAFVAQQCALGRRVSFNTYRAVNHYQTRQVALQDALAWIKNVAAAKPVSLYCGR